MPSVEADALALMHEWDPTGELAKEDFRDTPDRVHITSTEIYAKLPSDIRCGASYFLDGRGECKGKGKLTAHLREWQTVNTPTDG